jgi:aspartokinase-like uncharacterized kinase
MTVVLKLGGSLLDLPDLKQRLLRLIAQEYSNRPVLFLVGGGQIVDAVRHYDSIHHLQTEPTHWLCVELMNSTAAMVQQLCDWPLLSESRMLAKWLQARPTALPKPAIVAPSAFYSPQLNSPALPLSWDSTSDSIAALLAQIVAATELVMLKSTDEASTSDEPLWDKVFESVVPPGGTVRVVNLRAFP